VKKRTVPIALIMALLFLAAAERLYVDVGKAAFWSVPELPPPIYIQSDGSIEPPSDCIQQVGDTYILTRDIDNSIEVQRDHIVIDGNGFSITQIPINTSGFMIPAGFYPGIRLNDRINLTVQNVKIHACFSGITFECAKNITLTNNSIASIGKIAIFSGSSSNCTFSQNDIIGNDQGILIINSTRIHISENNIKRNRIGIQISSSGYPNHYVAITRNNISGSTDTGIAVYGGFQIIIVGNNIADNGRGLFVSYTDCTVHHNNFVNNAESVDSSSCPGPWDEGGEGNHWSDYNGTDVNSDGIGDTPLFISTGNIDNYPLMPPYITRPWDLTGPVDWMPDRKCDIRDVAIVSVRFGSAVGDGVYDVRADITGPTYLVKDGKIDIRDIALVALHFGETY